MMNLVQYLKTTINNKRGSVTLKHYSKQSKKISSNDESIVIRASKAAERRAALAVWPVTARGRRAAKLTMVCVSAVAASVQIAPHTILINIMKYTHQHAPNERPVVISPEMRQLLQEVANDIGLTTKEAIDFFVASPRIGQVTGYGDIGYTAILGYPYFYHYTSADEVPMGQMKKYGGEKLTSKELESEEAAMLAGSLVLSDSAKKFAIACEISMMRGHTHYINATIAAAFTMLAYLIPRDINHRYGLYKDVRKFRILIYTVVSSILLLYFFLLKDCLHKKGQGRAIETTASISQDYAHGGVEHYTKVLQRNQALRAFNPEGGSHINLLGEDVTWLRIKTKPLTECRAMCLEKMKTFET